MQQLLISDSDLFALPSLPISDAQEDQACEADDEWWMEAESTASQTELMYFGKLQNLETVS